MTPRHLMKMLGTKRYRCATRFENVFLFLNQSDLKEDKVVITIILNLKIKYFFQEKERLRGDYFTPTKSQWE